MRSAQWQYGRVPERSVSPYDATDWEAELGQCLPLMGTECERALEPSDLSVSLLVELPRKASSALRTLAEREREREGGEEQSGERVKLTNAARCLKRASLGAVLLLAVSP